LFAFTDFLLYPILENAHDKIVPLQVLLFSLLSFTTSFSYQGVCCGIEQANSQARQYLMTLLDGSSSTQ